MVNKKLKRAKRHGGITVSNYTFSRLQSGVRKGGPAHTLGQSDFISANIAFETDTGLDDSPLTIIDDTTRNRQAFHISAPRPYHNSVQHNHAAGLSRNQMNQHGSSSNQSPTGSTNQYGNSPNSIDNTSQQRGSTANTVLTGHRGATPANQFMASTSDPAINLINTLNDAGIEQTPGNNTISPASGVPTPNTRKILGTKIPLFETLSETEKSDKFSQIDDYISARNEIINMPVQNKNTRNKIIQYTTLIKLLGEWGNNNRVI